MSPQSRRLAVIAGAVVLAGSAAIWLLGRQSVDLEPPDLVSRGLASAILLAVPGIIGLIGASLGRRTVVMAAGVLCLVESAIAFSGATLIYLVPAIAFLRSATARNEAPPTPPIQPIRVLVAAVVSVPIAILVIFNLGILGILALAILAGLAASRPRGATRLEFTCGDALRGVAIVALVIGAWVATFVLAETTCWIGHGTPGGAISWERIPPSNTGTLGPGDVVSTCSGGTITPAGVGGAGGLVAIAIAIAALPVRRGRPASSFD